MKFHFHITAFIVILLATGCGKDQTPDPNALPNGYQLVWSDEFNYAGLPDSTKWSYNTGGGGWGNNEAEYYTKARLQNAEVKDGTLCITALKEDYGGKSYTSARLATRGKGDWVYGRFDVRAKLPSGVGMWPAIWMLPTDYGYGGGFASGELDIMENLGYLPGFILSTVQSKSYNHVQATQKSGLISVPDCYTQFHNYIMEWEPNEIRFYVDSRLFFTFTNDGAGFETWPFDKRFHLLLNVAVGGTYGGAQGIDESIFPQAMVVDYVRVYQKK
jgi:beta-glucanase (GH16 family)